VSERFTWDRVSREMEEQYVRMAQVRESQTWPA
jgi:hypothetical protein